MKNKLLLSILAMAAIGTAEAAVTIIPQSALLPSTQYYTTDIGGGIGNALIMTGGGNAANVGGSRNDDGFSGPIGLGFTLNFFGGSYTTFWANNNGNVSFTAGISAFNPTGPQGASQPIISPFFQDVDTRNSTSGLMYLRNDIANQIIVTWDAVGRYSAHGSPFDSFQLVLRGPGYSVPVGEGRIGFFWNDMGWETADVSPTPGAVGFGDGQQNGEVLQGSTQAGISRVVANHRLWFTLDSSGVPQPVCGVPGAPPCGVPEPESLSLMGLALAGLAMALWRRRTVQA